MNCVSDSMSSKFTWCVGGWGGGGGGGGGGVYSCRVLVGELTCALDSMSSKFTWCVCVCVGGGGCRYGMISWV